MVVSDTLHAGDSTSLQHEPSSHGPLRIQLADAVGRGALDGAWWPYSRDLRTEAVDLADHFPESFGRIVRLIYSGADWDEGAGRRVRSGHANVTLAAFPHDDNHRILVSSDRGGATLQLLVVPSDSNDADARTDMDTASSSGNLSATAILARPRTHA